MKSATPAGGRALVNQTAFELFRNGYESGAGLAQYLSFIATEEAVKEAEMAVIGLEVLSQTQREESAELARRMWLHFSHTGRPDLVIKPFYEGCGIIDACRGDVMLPQHHIVELKDGDRPFRSYEFRQLSIYAALYLNEHGDVPSTVEVLNSRRGVYVRVPLEQFANEVAGQSAVDYLREIIRVLTDEATSR